MKTKPGPFCLPNCKHRKMVPVGTIAEQARAYLSKNEIPSYVDPGFRVPETRSQVRGGHTMARARANTATQEKVAEAISETSTKKAKKNTMPEDTEEVTKSVAPLSDKELADLTARKEAEKDPQERAKLRRQLRAALKARGEYVPVSERPKKEKKAKKAVEITTEEVIEDVPTKKSKKNKKG